MGVADVVMVEGQGRVRRRVEWMAADWRPGGELLEAVSIGISNWSRRGQSRVAGVAET